MMKVETLLVRSEDMYLQDEVTLNGLLVEADEVTRSIIEGGMMQLRSEGLEAAARFLSANMSRLQTSRRAALKIEPVSSVEMEPALV